MTQANKNRIDTMLIECATALMSACGTTVVFDPAGEQAHTPQDGFLAVIGFVCPQMRGSLVLSANHGILRSSCPVRTSGVEIDPDTLQDWAGELANQLLGRLKSRLLAHGVTIQFGIPTTVSGLELRVRSCTGLRPSTPLWLYSTSSHSDWVVVRLDILLAEESPISLSQIPNPGSAAVEGDILLF